MPEIELSAEVLAGFAGVIVSVLFSYFPALRDKFAGMSAEAKSGIMLGVLAAVTAVITAMDYFNVIDAGIVFDGKWWAKVLFVFISAVIANQATYKISPPTRSVKLAKALRNYDECQEMYLEARGEE
jgi:hypothetical protein